MKTKLISINNDVAHQNKILQQWITINYGPRCKIYERGCVICEVWEYYDSLKLREFKENNFVFSNEEDLKKLERLRKKQAEEFVGKIKDSPGAFVYLKGLVR